jgi:inner membrane protein
MDPLTQAALGGAVAQTRGRPRELAKALAIGALAGMAPDLDVLIRSEGDPLLALEFHRHFTHSLLFIPFGALICALAFYPLLAGRWNLTFKQIYLWCLLGYGSHGLLDACTTYGTQLLWPLSNDRFAWDWISVVDPLFTLPLLALVILAAVHRKRGLTLVGLIWGLAYIGLGAIQHERALQLGEQLARDRGHQPQRLEAKPSFGNLAVWKVVYETEQHFYVDAVKPGWSNSRVWQGDSVPKLDLARDLPWLTGDTQQARDIERFRWFSAGYIALDQNDPRRVVDIRYSLLPHRIDPLWGIQLDQGATSQDFARYYTDRGDGRKALGDLWQMIVE